MSILTTSSGGYYSGRLGISTIGSTLASTFNSTNVALAYKILLPESKTLEDVVLCTGVQVGSGCDLILDVQTSTTTSAPSGTSASGYTPQTISAASLSANSIAVISFATPITLSAWTTYWIVFSTPNGSSTNYHQIRYGMGSSGLGGDHLSTYIAKSVASWSPQPVSPNGSGVVVRFSDGSEHGVYLGASSSIISSLVYGTRYARYNFFVPTSLLTDGVEIRMGCQGTPSALIYTLRDASGTSIASGRVPPDAMMTSSTHRACVLQWVPTWLTPGYYTITLQQESDGGSLANYYSVVSLVSDVPSGSTRDNVYGGPIQVSWDFTTDGSSWVSQSTIPAAFALSIISIGDFYNIGSIALDSSVKDGATGSSVRLRAASDLVPYSYRRYYAVTTSGSKTYSIKMRRSATTSDQPLTQQVQLVKASDNSVLATLNADASANGAFASYSTSPISLTAGDVVYILFSTSLKPGQDSGQGFAWFDTETWT